MISNVKVIKYKVIDLSELYNFNIKFVFTQLNLEKLYYFTTPIFRGGPHC
jgi:hypothetical protein